MDTKDAFLLNKSGSKVTIQLQMHCRFMSHLTKAVFVSCSPARAVLGDAAHTKEEKPDGYITNKNKRGN